MVAEAVISAHGIGDLGQAFVTMPRDRHAELPRPVVTMAVSRPAFGGLHGELPRLPMGAGAAGRIGVPRLAAAPFAKPLG